MKTSLKWGFLIFLIIMVFSRERKDSDYSIPEEKVIIPHNGDSARHYHQDFTPFKERGSKKDRPINVNID